MKSFIKSIFKSNKRILACLLAFLICIVSTGCGVDGNMDDGPDMLIGEAIVGDVTDESDIPDLLTEDTDSVREDLTEEKYDEIGQEQSESKESDIDQDSGKITLGDERFDEYLPLLEGKRVAVFTNQSGIVGDVVTDDDSEGDPDWVNFRYGQHITEALISKNVNLSVIFSPEHGFSGTAGAGAAVGDSVLNGTDIAIVSLYGGTDNTLNEENMGRFETLLVDIQDVGLRFYTYYITMFNLMEKCAEYGKDVIVLDRPNPNGFYVDGPILKEGYTSGVGMLPIPIVHGMTLGELALMMNGEGWLKTGKDSCSVKVITCENYKHSDHYELVCRPSPNLKDMRAVYLYPSTCLFENTVVSVGRGTYHPFEVFGSPYLAGTDGYDFAFTPESMEGAENPQYSGQTCFGRSLVEKDIDSIFAEGIDLSYIQDAYNTIHSTNPDISFFGNPDGSGRYWIDLLCGTSEVRTMIEQGVSAHDIEMSWKNDINAFRESRKPYLLYEDID